MSFLPVLRSLEKYILSLCDVNSPNYLNSKDEFAMRNWFYDDGAQMRAFFVLVLVLIFIQGCTTGEKSPEVVVTKKPVNKMETDDYYHVCPKMKVSNAPKIDNNRRIKKYQPYINVNGVTLALVPLRGGCLSSGFGPRNGGWHKGIDFYQRPADMVYAAADGVILEREFYKTYGNMIVIDHGEGVYTCYAHLKNFERNTRIGSKVKAGAALGIMGNTSTIRIPVNLHYGLLTGDYNNPKRAYGLKAHDPFSFVGR